MISAQKGSCGERILSEFVVFGLLGGAESHFLLFELGQFSSPCASFLHSQVLWSVSALLGGLSGGVSSLLAQDSQAFGDGFSHLSDLGELNLRLGGDLGHSEFLKFSLSNTTRTS